MKNQIILFSNIKGGVGKTTLCSIFANYLVEKGVPVYVIDADLQASLYRHRQREVSVDPETPVPWAVNMLDTTDENLLSSTLEKLKSIPGAVLIDCPGNLNDKNLSLIYQAADVAVIPMTYDMDTVDATGLFVKAMKRCSNAKLIFTPNRINTSEGKSEELRQRTQTSELLSLIGDVTPRIKQCVAVKRYTTLYPIESKQMAAVEPAFSMILEQITLK